MYIWDRSAIAIASVLRSVVIEGAKCTPNMVYIRAATSVLFLSVPSPLHLISPTSLNKIAAKAQLLSVNIVCSIIAENHIGNELASYPGRYKGSNRDSLM